MCGLVSRLRPFLWVFLLAIFLVGVAPQLRALEITEAQMAQLEQVFRGLVAANAELKTSLEKAETSFNAYVKETQADRQRLVSQANCWKISFLVSITVALVTESGLVLYLVLRR